MLRILGNFVKSEFYGCNVFCVLWGVCGCSSFNCGCHINEVIKDTS